MAIKLTDKFIKEYDMAGIKWIGSGPMNIKKGLPRASVTVILNDPDTKLPLCFAADTLQQRKPNPISLHVITCFLFFHLPHHDGGRNGGIEGFAIFIHGNDQLPLGIFQDLPTDTLPFTTDDHSHI